MNPSPKTTSNPATGQAASGYSTPDSGNISDTVTYEDLEILDASLGSKTVGPGGNTHPSEIQVKTNNLIEVSTGRVEGKCTPEKIFKYLIFMGCLLFLLITVIILGLKHSGETETLKQCLPGYYNFPECKKCECTSDGSTLDCYDTGDCICKHGYHGSKCDKCKEGFTGNKCDECKPNITGHDCNQCKPKYFNYPLCQECVCNSDGSTSLDCDEDYGNCSCKEGFAGIKCHECMPNVIGDKCDTCQPGFLGYPSCRQEEKVLIATGFSSDDGINSEIIDVEDSNFICTNIEPFPVSLDGASGGLMNGEKPFICGGRAYDDWTFSHDCFQLTEAGSWVTDQSATLTTGRSLAGIGTVVLNNNLVISGGHNGIDFWLASIEMLSPNTTAQTLIVQLTTGLYGHCQVPWDSETFFVIGGNGKGGDNPKRETYFINVKTNQKTNGPILNIPRYLHSCGELEVNGNTYIIVSGGYKDYDLRSTEVLDKSNVGQGWEKENDFEFPVDKNRFQMVSSPDKKALYAIGGANGYNDDTNDIYKFHCSGTISTCKWTKSETTLRIGRSSFVAIPIPNVLADKLCSTDQTTLVPTNPTTAGPINPTTTTDPTMEECKCNPDGSRTLECGKDNGVCTCKEGFSGVKCDECLPNVIGDNCDTCQGNLPNFPYCKEDEKILLVTGLPQDNGRKTEIVDVEDSNFSCTNIEQFPVMLYAASGGLMNGQTPFICGGYGNINGWTFSNECYQLTEAGSWDKDQIATLTTPRERAGYGTVMFNNKLVLTGGYSDGKFLSSIEMLSPNATAKTLSVQLPAGFSAHCQVPWDSDKFMVIGGMDGGDRDETYLINVKTNLRISGPKLNTARSDHACAELHVNGKDLIIVTGGWNVRSTEILDKSNVGQGWQNGDDFDLPVSKRHFQMVSTLDKKALYAIGGYDSSYSKDIFKFHCPGDINTCRWTISETTLKLGRSDFVAIPIPNSMADSLCAKLN